MGSRGWYVEGFQDQQIRYQQIGDDTDEIEDKEGMIEGSILCISTDH